MSEPTIDPHEGAPAAEPAAPAFKITDDKNQVTVGDATYIRAEALHQERNARQELQRQVDGIAPYVDEFNEFLTQKQTREAARTARVAPPAAEGAYPREDLEGVATVRGYVDAEGKPDLARAAQDLALMDRYVEARVSRAIAPVARTASEERAYRNRESAKGRQFVDGRPLVDAKYVDQAFDALPPELAADPNVANIVQVIAVGLEQLDARKTGRAQVRREPVFTEEGRGRFDAEPGGLSQFDIRAAQARGISQADWAKRSEKPTPTGRVDRDGGYVFDGEV